MRIVNLVMQGGAVRAVTTGMEAVSVVGSTLARDTAATGGGTATVT